MHHVVPWEQGGVTDVDNGVAKCRRCHLEHHRKRWVDRLDSDGTYRVLRADGTEIATRPAGIDDQLPLLPVATTSEPARVLRISRRRQGTERHGGCYRDPAVIELLGELTRLRLRHGDDDPLTIDVRSRAWALMDELDRAA